LLQRATGLSALFPDCGTLSRAALTSSDRGVEGVAKQVAPGGK
jgi:hypothetical protein